MTLPGRYNNIGGVGGYLSSSYNTSNYYKSSSFAKDLKNQSYFLTLTTLNRSLRYPTLTTSEVISNTANNLKLKECSLEESQSGSPQSYHPETCRKTTPNAENDSGENEKREVIFKVIFSLLAKGCNFI